MCRRLFIAICCFGLLVCCWPAAALAAGGDGAELVDGQTVEDFTAADLYRLCGIDPEDQEAVDLLLVRLYAYDGTTYADFVKQYTLWGYADEGLQVAYFAFCSIHDYDFDLTGIYDPGSSVPWTRYYGDSVRIIRIYNNNEGVTPGWYIGVGSNSATSGSINKDEYMFNLTEMQKEIKNAVTYSDLSPLTTILNSINSNIQIGNSYIKLIDGQIKDSVLPHMSTMVDHLAHIRPDVLAIKDDLVSFTDYMSSGKQAIFSYYFSTPVTSAPTSSSTQPEGLLQILANGFNAVTKTSADIETHRFLQFSDFLSSRSFNLVGYGYNSSTGKVLASVTRGSGFYFFLEDFYQSHFSALASLDRSLHTYLSGQQTNVSLPTLYYDEQGSLQSDSVSVNANLVTVMSTLAQAIQRDSAALRFVLADDDAIRLHASNKPLEGAIEDEFTGGSAAAPGVDDIKDAAAITSGMKDIFAGNSASSGDFFAAATDDSSYSFFSQATESSLDEVGASEGGQAAAYAVDDWLSRYEFDEDGFGHLKDSSYFALPDFGGKS